MTKFACESDWAAPGHGGESVLHPSRPDAPEWFSAVDGAGFESVTAQTVRLPPLPRYLPQIRYREALRGHLDEGIYAIRAHEVIGSRSRILTASQVRHKVGLSENQRLVLLLFDDDRVLERLMDAKVMVQLAGGHFDAITAPSFSAWTPRPRIEHLINFKRSLAIFEAFQAFGVPAIPRVGWAICHDAVRWAAWVNVNHEVSTVGLDLMTFRTSKDWLRQIDGLAVFEELSDRPLKYLINGPSSMDRFDDLFSLVQPNRITVTNARAMARPPGETELRRHGDVSGDKSGLRFAGRVRAERETLALRSSKASIASRSKLASLNSRRMGVVVRR